MFVLELAFSDDPARLEYRPAHRELMATLKAEGKVLVGGPFGDGAGALIVFMTDSVEEAQALVDADPYNSAPGVTVRNLRQLNAVTRHPAIADL